VKVTLIAFARSDRADLSALGVRQLSSCLGQAGHDVRLIFACPDRRERLTPRILTWIRELSRGSGLVGVSLVSYYFEHAARLTDDLRRSLGVPVIWGGFHPTARPEECLRHAGLVCLGEGEGAVVDLANALHRGDGAEDIPNVWVRHGGRIVRNPPRPLVHDLDALPLPDYDFANHFLVDARGTHPLNDEKFQRHSTWDDRFNYVVHTSRGCPHHCAYCGHDVYHDLYRGQQMVRKRSVGHVITELRQAVSRWPGIQRIDFWEDHFAYDDDEILELRQRFPLEIGVPFRVTGFTPATLTRRRLEWLIDAGMRQLIMGVQTVAPGTMMMYRRRFPEKRIAEMMRLIHEYADVLVPRYDLIVDNPWEPEEDILRTLLFVASIPPPFELSVYSLAFFPGSRLHTRAVDEGMLDDEPGHRYRQWVTQGSSTPAARLLRLISRYAKLGRQIPAKVIRTLASPPVRGTAAAAAAVSLLHLAIAPWHLRARLVSRGWLSVLSRGPSTRGTPRSSS